LYSSYTTCTAILNKLINNNLLNNQYNIIIEMSSNYTDHDPKELAAIRQYELAIERHRIRRRNEFKKECKNLFASIN